MEKLHAAADTRPARFFFFLDQTNNGSQIGWVGRRPGDESGRLAEDCNRKTSWTCDYVTIFVLARLSSFRLMVDAAMLRCCDASVETGLAHRPGWKQMANATPSFLGSSAKVSCKRLTRTTLALAIDHRNEPSLFFAHPTCCILSHLTQRPASNSYPGFNRGPVEPDAAAYGRSG
jgi:hypothetical protein